ncbi:hypothetical protein ADZ36_16510 [Streptomyces fradiae]|uniref:Uncharacterized protein n=1 Tax=Streptomyces fradiae TaxID=1906 RepID=A0ACC4WA30_STRFR|nr:hypothetical protein [Streptomyces fradiae]KNE81431.1 hypothetical protein ADZ36_16510 [Streptomyces fradiae]OFA48285.1 hypothetical protein BEN35_19255 [Streptomyces fradiae]
MYDDPDQPDQWDQWAWRYGYFELLYTPGIKTLSLSRGPKYSVNPERCCRRCHGTGYLPWSERTTPDDAATPSVRCPTCPTHRTLFEHLPLRPPHFFDWLRHRFGARRRTADHPPAPHEGTRPDGAGGYDDEPPF